MEANKYYFDLEKSLGKNFFVTAIEPAHRWDNGKETEEICGWKVTIVLPEREFEKTIVKVAKKPAEAVFSTKNCAVSFDNLSASLYTFNDKIYVCLKADVVRPKTKNAVDA